MPRNRREPSVLETALTSRWPFAAAMCGLSAVVGWLVLPGVLASTPAFRPVGEMIRTIALFPIVGFGVLAVVKYLRESTAGASHPSDHRSTVGSLHPQPSTRYPGASDDPVGSTRTEPSLRPSPERWSLALLQSIEWKRFEQVVAAYFRAKNFRGEMIERGPDGGVDVRLYFADLPEPAGVVQCKAWGSKPVGVGPVRELLGVMAHEKVKRGYFCATGDFTPEAIAFAASNPIQLITGGDLIAAIAQMPSDVQAKLLAVSTSGDYTTPTCPSCGIKLVERKIGGRMAWGCRNYPRCRTKIFHRRERRAA